MNNPELKLKTELGIDIGPSDKSKLTIDEIKEELKKLTDIKGKTGFLYFLVEYVTVEHVTRGNVPLKTNMYEWQWKAAQEFLAHKLIISLKQRQIGYSTITGAYALWRNLFFESQNVAVVSLGQRESIKFLKRIKFIYKYLPAWMKAKTSEWSKTFIELEDTSSSVASLPNTEDPARGESLSLLIGDEFGAFKNAKAFLAAAGPTVSTGMLEKFEDGILPSQFFLISTLPRNPVNNEYLRILHKAQTGDSEYHLVDTEVDDIPHYKSEEWHRMQRDTLGERLYKLEILKQEVYDIENSFLPGNVTERLVPKEPIRVDFVYPDDVNEEGYMKNFDKMLLVKDEFDPEYNYIKGFWVWEDAKPQYEYVVTCDVATGRAGDWSVAEVFCLNTCEQVAEYRGKSNLEQFKEIIESIINYYGEAKLSIESTGLGQGIVDYFSETLNYENLYWHQRSKHKIVPGFPMSSPMRANSLAMFASIMTKEELKINSVRTINEMRGFGYTRAGRIQGIGVNDDLVMAIVQLCYLINNGFASSENTIQEHLVFGTLIKEIDADKEKQKEKPKTVKYWMEKFDCEFDQETEDFLKMAEASGVSVPLAMMELLHNKASDDDDFGGFDLIP